MAARARKYLKEIQWSAKVAQEIGSLEFVSSKIFNEDLFLGLNLEELEKQTDKLCWSLVSINSSNILDFNCLVYQRFRWEDISLAILHPKSHKYPLMQSNVPSNRSIRRCGCG